MFQFQGFLGAQRFYGVIKCRCRSNKSKESSFLYENSVQPRADCNPFSNTIVICSNKSIIIYGSNVNFIYHVTTLLPVCHQTHRQCHSKACFFSQLLQVVHQKPNSINFNPTAAHLTCTADVISEQIELLNTRIVGGDVVTNRTLFAYQVTLQSPTRNLQLKISGFNSPEVLNGLPQPFLRRQHHQP